MKKNILIILCIVVTAALQSCARNNGYIINHPGTADVIDSAIVLTHAFVNIPT